MSQHWDVAPESHRPDSPSLYIDGLEPDGAIDSFNQEFGQWQGSQHFTSTFEPRQFISDLNRNSVDVFTPIPVEIPLFASESPAKQGDEQRSAQYAQEESWVKLLPNESFVECNRTSASESPSSGRWAEASILKSPLFGPDFAHNEEQLISTTTRPDNWIDVSLEPTATTILGNNMDWTNTTRMITHELTTSTYLAGTLNEFGTTTPGTITNLEFPRTQIESLTTVDAIDLTNDVYSSLDFSLARVEDKPQGAVAKIDKPHKFPFILPKLQPNPSVVPKRPITKSATKCLVRKRKQSFSSEQEALTLNTRKSRQMRGIPDGFCATFTLNTSAGDRQTSSASRHRRAVKTCLRCHTYHLRCSGGFPCSNCLGIAVAERLRPNIYWQACFDSDILQLDVFWHVFMRNFRENLDITKSPVDIFDGSYACVGMNKHFIMAAVLFDMVQSRCSEFGQVIPIEIRDRDHAFRLFRAIICSEWIGLPRHPASRGSFHIHWSILHLLVAVAYFASTCQIFQDQLRANAFCAVFSRILFAEIKCLITKIRRKRATVLEVTDAVASMMTIKIMLSQTTFATTFVEKNKDMAQHLVLYLQQNLSGIALDTVQNGIIRYWLDCVKILISVDFSKTLVTLDGFPDRVSLCQPTGWETRGDEQRPERADLGFTALWNGQQSVTLTESNVQRDAEVYMDLLGGWFYSETNWENFLRSEACARNGGRKLYEKLKPRKLSSPINLMTFEEVLEVIASTLGRT